MRERERDRELDMLKVFVSVSRRRFVWLLAGLFVDVCLYMLFYFFTGVKKNGCTAPVLNATLFDFQRGEDRS